MNATALRADLYRILERILETGVPVVVELRGRKVEIRPTAPPGKGKLARLVSRPNVLADDGSVSAFDEKAWTKKWNRRLTRR
jgi:hypothetical protein